jgi:hypothetical protein
VATLQFFLHPSLLRMYVYVCMYESPMQHIRASHRISSSRDNKHFRAIQINLRHTVGEIKIERGKTFGADRWAPLLELARHVRRDTPITLRQDARTDETLTRQSGET